MSLQLWLPDGVAPTNIKCPGCDGSGGRLGRTCPGCEGNGMVRVEDLDSRIVDRCTIPLNAAGDVCGHPFFAGEDRVMHAHITRCASENADAIQAYRERTHPAIMEPWDTEQYEWIRRNGAAILEGRKKI